MRYIEKVALDWSEKGINTLEQAEKYLTGIERLKSYQHKIIKMLNIDRSLSPKEKSILQQWESELKPTDELIIGAYETCIERKNKFSLSYINGIITDWTAKGYKSKEDILSERKPAAKPTAFSNFTPRKGIDYDKLENEALERRIRNSEFGIRND